jgi:hypothetical protein
MNVNDFCKYINPYSISMNFSPKSIECKLQNHHRIIYSRIKDDHPMKKDFFFNVLLKHTNECMICKKGYESIGCNYMKHTHGGFSKF